ncbi:MAG: hypothetical protein ACLVJ6_17955 [Merdibacter sp.]
MHRFRVEKPDDAAAAKASGFPLMRKMGTSVVEQDGKYCLHIAFGFNRKTPAPRVF